MIHTPNGKRTRPVTMSLPHGVIVAIDRLAAEDPMCPSRSRKTLDLLMQALELRAAINNSGDNPEAGDE